MASYTVGYFVGSLATTSINRLLSMALVKLAPPEHRKFLHNYMAEFHGFIARVYTVLPRNA